MTDSAKKDSQPYDSLVKHLFRSEARKIVPLLLQGAELVGDVNIEIDRSTLRVDLALKIRYLTELAILHFEAQSGEDEDMEKRMSIYNAGLHSTYGLPVISILLYLFECDTVKSPYHVMCAGRECSSCYYDVIRLWEVDPQPYIDHYAVSLYVLLPGMKDPSIALLKGAIKAICEYYDERRAVERLIQFGVMLKRTTTVSESNKQKIQEVLEMYTPYQQFISQNPDVERYGQQREMEGEIKYAQKSILNILSFRFSNDMLIDLAKQALGSIHDIEILGQLELEALRSPDEQDVHQWLGKYLPQNKTAGDMEGEEE
ncbi:MAG TPA: hypothetical protein VGL94_20600 [Ktedonobacteraceae bacterium]